MKLRSLAVSMTMAIPGLWGQETLSKPRPLPAPPVAVEGTPVEAVPGVAVAAVPQQPARKFRVDPGTKIPVSMINSISTKTAQDGEKVYLETVFPILSAGKVVIPPGSYVSGTVTNIKRPGRIKGRGEFYLRFDAITLPNGVTRDFRAGIDSLDGRASEELDKTEGKIKGEGDRAGDAMKVGEVATIGTGIGSLAGQAAGNLGKGALIGAGAGAAAGLAMILLTRGPDAVLAKGTTLEMVLERPLQFEEPELNFKLDATAIQLERRASAEPEIEQSLGTSGDREPRSAACYVVLCRQVGSVLSLTFGTSVPANHYGGNTEQIVPVVLFLGHPGIPYTWVAMEFGGPHTLSIFVSLVIVLAMTGVALVCDLLKGNNEHLRELAVELKIRNEEAERRVLVAEKRQRRKAAAPTAAKTPAMSEAPTEKPRVVDTPVEAPAPKASEPMERRHGARRERTRRQMSPAVAAVAEVAAGLVNRQAYSNGAEEAPTASRPAVPTSIGAGGRKNWDSILKSTRRGQGSVIPFESIREAVPAGYHDASALQRAVESGKILSGLVLSIGTNGVGAQTASQVAELLRSLAGPQDFTCQSGSDEYILICPGEQGAAAQRRMSAISEKLWDFQLQSIGGASVQFSWGSAEARGERIGEAVATAIEQMHETRHSRRAQIARAV